MKKKIALLMVFMLLLITACDNSGDEGNKNTTEEPMYTVTSIPEDSESAADSGVTSAETVNESGLSEDVTPEFKAAMDSYEAFFDEYISFMNKYKESGYDASMLTDYTNYMNSYTETMKKISEIDTDSLSTADMLYYSEVNFRISSKLSEVSF